VFGDQRHRFVRGVVYDHQALDRTSIGNAVEK
jgi:hypothetical protein